MGHSTRKRGRGGGDYGDPVLLGAVGLDKFARLELPAPPDDGLDVHATYNYASGRIDVSFHGTCFSASTADLAAALGLPPPAGTGADFLSSTEAIAAVRRFVSDRLLLGDGEHCEAASEEVAAALRLIDKGRAYEVDWAGLVWAVLKAEVVAGTPRRYVPYLLLLLEYHQRLELFAGVDEGSPLLKRWKGRTLQPGRCTDEKLGISEECEMEKDKEDSSIAYALSQDIGDLEEMPIFGEPWHCKGTFLEQGGIHESRGCAPSDAVLLDSDTECDHGQGIAPSDAHNQSSSSSWKLCVVNEQPDSAIPHQMICGTSSQPASYLQQSIEIEDEEDDDDGLGACLGSAVIRNGPLDISPYPMQQHGQTSLSVNGCIQQMSSVLEFCFRKAYSDKEEEYRQLQAEVQCLKEKVMEKQRVIDDTKYDVLKDLRAREAKKYRFEKEREMMLRCVHQYKELVQKSSAEFRQYKNMMVHGKCVDSYLGVTGVEKQKLASMQQLQSYCCWIGNRWCSASLGLDEKLKKMEENIANMNKEVKRLKESVSIPDLNNGTGEDGEDQTYQCKSEDRARTGEGYHVGSSEQKGKHLGESVANPAQIVKTEGSMDVNKVLGSKVI